MPITKPEVPATNPAAVTPAAEVAKPAVKPVAKSTTKKPVAKTTAKTGNNTGQSVPYGTPTPTNPWADQSWAKKKSEAQPTRPNKLNSSVMSVEQIAGSSTKKSTTTKSTTKSTATPTMLSGPTITGKRVVKPSGSQNKMSLSNAEVIKMANSELSYNDMRNLSPTDIKRIMNVRNG